MTDKSIAHLNFYCLLEIMNHIKEICEVNKITALDTYTKYDDLISFALTCEQFRNVLRECYPNLYDRLEIEQTYLIKLDHVIMDFDIHYKRLQKLSQKDKDVLWKIYMKCLQLNAQVEYIQLKYCREIYNRDHIEILDMFMSAIQNKRSIKRLCIDMEGCSLDRLPQLRHLENLDVNAKMDASYLADYCEANQSLVSLTFRSNEIYGKLTDIVPHCKNLQYLIFMVREYFNDSEYTQFAKLPSLRYLNILGAHESGSMCPLLKSLATRGPNTLRELRIDAAPMDIAEILEACRIESLAEFTCKFFDVKDFYLRILGNAPKDLYLYFENEIDATDLDILLNLMEFTSLHISGRHKAGTLKPFFKAIAAKESPKLEILRTENDEEDQSAIIFNNDEILEVLQIKSLRTLQCSYFDGLFKGFSQNATSKLDNLTVRGSPMSLEDLMEIRKFERLKDLTCGLVDVNTMYHLAQLTQLKVLTITSEHPRLDFSEAVFRFYEAFKGNVSIYSKGNWVKENTTDMKTTEQIPLDYLSIYGRNPPDSLTSLFKTFASNKSTVLQDLCIKNNTSPIEVKDIAQLKTLRYFTCEFTDSQSLQPLKHLPELESLITTSSQRFPDIADGVLSLLMGNETRANRDDRNNIFNKNLSNDSIDEKYDPRAQLPQLRSLHIIGRHKLGIKILKNLKNVVRSLALNNKQSQTEIVYKTKVESEETLELSQIASLKKLECGFSDVECVEILIKLTYLQELTITRHPEGFLKQFLQEITAREVSYLDTLRSSKDIGATPARVRFLKRLDCALGDEDYIHLLAKLSQLEELTIRDDKCVSLVRLFHALFLSESKSLQHLSITDRSISYEEMKIVARIKTLRELCCTLIDKESIKLLDQLPQLTKLSIELYEFDAESIEILVQLNKLTDLAIKSSKSGSLTRLFYQLSSRADPILKSLIITGKYIDSTEIDAIAQLKTLRRLQCGVEENKLYECLSELTNLEVLNVTSNLDLSCNFKALLTIIQKCHTLKVIEIQDSDGFVALEFISEALKMLKTVRNPQIQEALELRIRHFKCLTSEQKRFPADNFAEWNNGHPLGLRTVHAYVLVYDMGNLETFQYCRSIRDQILDSFSHRDFSIIVVGNKYDNVTEAQANSQELKDISTLVRKHWRCGYVECSAQYNYKIGDVFRELMGCSSGGVTGTTSGGLVGTDYSQSTRNKGRCTIL